jgi:4-amino-4-deoxy-L-arabinose transferase-like glycosyltransferase
MRITTITKNPYLLFSPFLCFYILYILLFPSDFSGDEIRYLRFAKNLIHGFYSPSAPDIDLTNGPGYPLLLSPFVAIGLPLIYIALMNAFFYYLSIILLFKALKQTVGSNIALIFSCFWACYYVAFGTMNTIVPETFTFLLVSLLIFSLVKVFKADNSKEIRRFIFLAGFTIGFIILTKMIFGYVLLLMLSGYIVFWITDIKNINYRKGIYILLIAFVTVTPYLIYTYHLTGRIFYWGSGSDSLYWMSTPYEGEYGDFKGELTLGTVALGNYNIPGADDTLRAHHGKDFEEILQYNAIERDDAFKRIAINNIKSHPIKFVGNWICNLGRLVFHYPFSYAVQRPKILLVLPMNGIVFTLILFCLIPTFINWRKVSFPVQFMLLFCFIYLSLSSLVTAFVRMFTIVVPIMVFWFAYIIQNSLVIKMKFDDP